MSMSRFSASSAMHVLPLPFDEAWRRSEECRGPGRLEGDVARALVDPRLAAGPKPRPRGLLTARAARAARAGLGPAWISFSEIMSKRIASACIA